MKDFFWKLWKINLICCVIIVLSLALEAYFEKDNIHSYYAWRTSLFFLRTWFGFIIIWSIVSYFINIFGERKVMYFLLLPPIMYFCLSVNFATDELYWTKYFRMWVIATSAPCLAVFAISLINLIKSKNSSSLLTLLLCFFLILFHLFFLFSVIMGLWS